MVRVALRFGAAFVGAALMAAPVTAVPTGTPNAEVDKGSGCYVKDDNDVYHYDPTCSYTLVTRVDRDGNLAIYSYHDEGQLPDDAPAPTSAERVTFDLSGGLSCSEVITPSGHYRSDCRY